MWRTIGAILAGVLGWAVIVTVINWGLRLGIPGYHLAEHTLVFTLEMKIARLTMAAVTSVATGVLVRLIAPGSRCAPWIVGLIVLALFVPAHIQLWHRFPIWYHLSFLVPLVPLVVLGAWLAARAPAQLPVSSSS